MEHRLYCLSHPQSPEVLKSLHIHTDNRDEVYTSRVLRVHSGS